MHTPHAQQHARAQCPHIAGMHSSPESAQQRTSTGACAPTAPFKAAHGVSAAGSLHCSVAQHTGKPAHSRTRGNLARPPTGRCRTAHYILHCTAQHSTAQHSTAQPPLHSHAPPAQHTADTAAARPRGPASRPQAAARKGMQRCPRHPSSHSTAQHSTAQHSTARGVLCRTAHGGAAAAHPRSLASRPWAAAAGCGCSPWSSAARGCRPPAPPPPCRQRCQSPRWTRAP